MQTSPSVMSVEGEDIMNRFRTVLTDPVMQRMDYQRSCIKASEIIEEQGIVDEELIAEKIKMCRDNCEHLNLLVHLRDKFEAISPAMVEAGLDGPDANQFRLEDDFCKSCLMARQEGLHRTWWQRRGDRRSERKAAKLQAKIVKVHDKAQLKVDHHKDLSRKQARVLRVADLLDDSPGNDDNIPEDVGLGLIEAGAAPIKVPENVPSPEATSSAAAAETTPPTPQPIPKASAPVPEPAVIVSEDKENAPAASPAPEAVSVLPMSQDLAQRLRYGSGRSRFAAETAQAIKIVRAVPVVSTADKEKPAEPVECGGA